MPKKSMTRANLRRRLEQRITVRKDTLGKWCVNIDHTNIRPRLTSRTAKLDRDTVIDVILDECAED